MNQTVRKSDPVATDPGTHEEVPAATPRTRGFSLSREEILADVRRAPRAYVRALKVDTDGE